MPCRCCFNWMWLDYAESREPFLDVYPCGDAIDEEMAYCLSELLMQTKKEMDGATIPQSTDFLRRHTDIDGEIYLVGKNSVERIWNKKSFTNTMGAHNEVLQVPNDTNPILFFAPAIRR